MLKTLQEKYAIDEKEETLRIFKIKINEKRLRYWLLQGRHKIITEIYLDNLVNEFKYLGSTIIADGKAPEKLKNTKG